MGDIDDALERAGRETFTREPPKTLKGRINFLMGKLKTTKAVAAELGVSQRSIERYRTGARKTPPKAITDRIDTAVRSRWQPVVRGRRRKEAATRTGITVETRARFGYTAPVGTTDDGRMRRLTVHLPRLTRNASSTPSSKAPQTRNSGRSSPKASRTSTSKTAAPAPRPSKSNSPTSTTSTSRSRRSRPPGAGAPPPGRHAAAVTVLVTAAVAYPGRG